MNPPDLTPLPAPDRRYPPDWNRILSVFVAVIWFVLGRTESVPSAFRTRTDGLVVLALACIWFPHVIETIYSLFESQSPSSANVSEAMGCLIRVVGWGMLIIMLIVRIAAALPS